MHEEDFAAARGAPFVGADGAVGGWDVAGAGEGVGRVGSCCGGLGVGEGRAVDSGCGRFVVRRELADGADEVVCCWWEGGEGEECFCVAEVEV